MYDESKTPGIKVYPGVDKKIGYIGWFTLNLSF